MHTSGLNDAPLPPAARTRFLAPRIGGLMLAALLSLTVGIVDYCTGRDLQVVPLYLAPVAVATWVGGRRMGLVFVLVCTGLWLAGELALNAHYNRAYEPYWNAAGLFVTFTVVCWILSGLHHSLETLERQVELRTADLHEEMQRRQAAEEARLQAERLAVVGTMAAQVAHEVRNPLGSMTLNIELLEDEISGLGKDSGQATHEAHFLLGQVQQEVHRIREVVDSYMQIARLPEIKEEAFDLHGFLHAKLRMITPELDAAGVRLTECFDPAIGRIVSDRDKLWQVLVNLIRNARQAMPEGGVITLQTLLADGGLRLCVTDTGKGISAAHLSKLFTPFFTTKSDGTGLGLVLVQQIIGEMGGKITCTSEPGHGATFVLSLPMARPGLPPSTHPNPTTELYDRHPQSTATLGRVPHGKTLAGGR